MGLAVELPDSLIVGLLDLAVAFLLRFQISLCVGQAPDLIDEAGRDLNPFGLCSRYLALDDFVTLGFYCALAEGIALLLNGGSLFLYRCRELGGA